MKQYDVVVVGAGPAGLAAAEQAALAGASVLAIDANEAPGGQLVKQIHKFFGSAEICAGVRGIRLAQRFYASALEHGCEFLLGAAVYALHAAPGGGWDVFAADGEKTRCFRAQAVVLALGASENALAFPGWTKPGVITAGAAQTLVNLSRVRVGRRALMVGAGNVGLIVSYQLMQAGISVAAVVEAAPRIGGYAVHADKIRRAGVPILTSHTVVEALGDPAVEAAIIAQVDANFAPIPGTERTLEADIVCLAVGLSPLVKLAAACGCKLERNPATGETIPWHDDNLMTSLSGVFVAGDVAGVEEASIALEEGALAGLAALTYLGKAGAGNAAACNSRLAALRGRGANVPPDYSLSAYEQYDTPKAVIECFEGIPCNPCEHVCPTGAIRVGEAITGLPRLDPARCTGCGKCVAACPGLACFLVNLNAGEDQAEITIPYEYLPAPEAGEAVRALSRAGDFVCAGKITRVRRLKDADNTALVTVAVPKQHAHAVRGVARGEVAAP